MLRSLKELERYDVFAADGSVGKCADFLVDRDRWILRYLVVETGTLLAKRPVLVPPKSVVEIEQEDRSFQLALTRATIEKSPVVDPHLLVSRQHEAEIYDYYGYPYYWSADLVDAESSPALIVAESSRRSQPEIRPPDTSNHVGSTKLLRGYALRATDATLGQLDDWIAQDDIWEIKYLVVDASNWWQGRKVLIAPQWITRVNHSEQLVDVNLSRQAIEGSPEWDPDVTLDREYETRLQRHYGLPSHWGNRERKLQSGNSPTSEAESLAIEKQRHQHE